MSYEQELLTLDRHGYILVGGTNNNPIDNAKSNGVGKSSLFSAISWALTGLTISGSKEVANIYLDGTTSVELEFSVDDVDYVLVRTKNPSNLKLFVNGENKSGKGIRDTEKILSEYLPDITYTLLSSVIILGQGLPQKFSSNTPSGRKEVLENLSNSDFMIVDLKNRVTTRGTYLKQQLREYENQITDLSARIDIVSKQLESAQAEYDTLDENGFNALSQTLATKVADKNNYEKQLLGYDTQISDIETALNAAVAEISNLATQRAEEFKNIELIDVTSITEKISNVRAEINQLSNEIVRLDNVTDVCPTCGQKLPNVHKIDTTDKKKYLQTLQAKLVEYQEEKDADEKNNAEILDSFNNSYSVRQEQLNTKYEGINSQLISVRSTRSNIESALKTCDLQIQSLQSNINDFEIKKSTLADKILLLNEQISDYKSKILYYNNNVKILTEHVDVNNKMSTILSRDFRGYLLENVISFIATQAKQYALDIFGTDKLNFTLDGNNISIIYDGKDYDVLSGGEKQKIDVIVQLAIRDMLCSFLNFSSNILVLDEITDNLDIVGCQKMFNLISTKLNDVEAVYIISHHQDDFDIPYDDQITITKGVDKISRITAA